MVALDVLLTPSCAPAFLCVVSVSQAVLALLGNLHLVVPGIYSMFLNVGHKYKL